MSSASQHDNRARRYLNTATRIGDSDTEAGGEIKWLAAVQAAQCAGHLQNTDYHPHSRKGIRDIIGRLHLPQQQRNLLYHALDATVRHLHLAAYNPHTVDANQHGQAHQHATYLIHALLEYHESNSP